MGSQEKGKVNRLAGLLEEGLLASTSWLEEQEYSRPLLGKYVESGWLESPARGVYRRPGPPLNKEIAQGNDPPPVWPHAQGKVRGYGLKPLYKSVPLAAERDPELYELLALVDAIRDGRARERALATREIEARLGG
jgi:hypothetical protein